jgi:cytochrome P450
MVALYRGLPFLGALPELRRDLLGTFEKIAKLGDVVRVALPLRRGYLVSHPDGVKRVLVDNHKNYGKQTRGYQMLRLALGEGLVTSEGEFWRRQRRIAQPAFHHQKIAAFGEIMTHATNDMIERWHKHTGVIEMHDEMMQLTLRIVGQCLMSTDLSDSSDFIGNAVTTVLEETVHRVQHPLSLPLSIPTPRNVRFRRALEDIDKLVIGLIRERKSSGKSLPDLLGMLMEARDEETGESMSERHLRDEVMTMISAGHETTANALTWTFYLLSENPRVQEELARELRAVLGGRTPGIEDLPRLLYTEAVVKESMRVFPPVWMIARSAEADDEILGVPIPRGSMVFLPPWITHKDPRFWERPSEFWPERWLQANIESLPKHAYYPFAGGPRVCIGNTFAMMEAKLVLAMIAGVFAPKLLAGHPVVPSPTVTLRPKHGMRMTLNPRDLLTSNVA